MTNFKEMTKEELIAYIKAHRTDDEAIHELFVNRRNPNGKNYPYHQSDEEIKQIFREQLSLEDRPQ